MQREATLQDDSLVLELEDIDAVQAFMDAGLRDKGFVVSVPQELRMFQRLNCSLRQGDRFRFSLEVEVIQVFPAGGQAFATAFQIVGWTSEAKRRLDLAIQNAARGDASQAAGAAVSPAIGIREMNVTEKLRLASKASHAERLILVQDHSPQVLMALLANPRIEPEEVLQIIKSHHASSGILQHISSNQRWLAVYDIQRALVLNPKTPTPLVLRLLELLSTSDLGALAKLGKARENVRKAALRVYLKRTGK